jgi:hypothetical protein
MGTPTMRATMTLPAVVPCSGSLARAEMNAMLRRTARRLVAIPCRVCEKATNRDRKDSNCCCIVTSRGKYILGAELSKGGGISAMTTSSSVYGYVTVNNSLTPLSAMLTDAVDDGLIVTNAARQPRRARHGSARRKVYLDAKRQAPKFLDLTGPRRCWPPRRSPTARWSLLR